jgi:hypothetical protein
MIPDNPDTKLGRRATAQALTEAGHPIAEATLATMGTRGGGPPFEKWNRKPLYRWGTSLEWARARTSRPIRRASELKEATDGAP